MEHQEEHVTIQMAALDRQLFVEMSATRGSDQPTQRVPVVSQQVGARPRAVSRGGAKMRLKRALEWGVWGLLMVAPAFALSC